MEYTLLPLYFHSKNVLKKLIIYIAFSQETYLLGSQNTFILLIHLLQLFFSNECLSCWHKNRNRVGMCCVQLLSHDPLCNPMVCSSPDSSVHGDSPGKNTGLGCHVLLQGIFPTQGSNPSLPHCRQILYCLNHSGSPVGIGIPIGFILGECT